MPGGLVEVGFVGEDHIEVGPVVEGRIAASLCPLFQLCHTWSLSAQHIQGPLVTPHDGILGLMGLIQVGRRECCQCSPSL